MVFMNIGHGNKKVAAAITEQLGRIEAVCPFDTTDVRAALARKIVEDIAPDNMGKVMFTLAGADANEYAIRIAKKYTGRTKVMAQYYSYHGSTYGATNLNGENDRVSPEPPIAGFLHFFGPNWRTSGLDFKDEDEACAFYLRILREQIEREDPRTIAAIFLETITGTNGAIIPPRGYHKGVREICDEYGILMVCDEVMMGFGRTGKWFAIEHFDVKPDIITFAKGVTSGYIPLGGVLVSKEIAEFYEDAEFPCGLTYNSHPVAMAAALATLEVLEEEKIIENSAEMGEYLLNGLKELQKKHPSIEEVRGKGLMCAFSTLPMFAGEEDNDKLVEMLLEEGYSTFTGHYGAIIVAPPLTVTKEEIDGILNAIDKVLKPFDERVPK